MRDVFYDVFVMFILRYWQVFKRLQFIDGHVVVEMPVRHWFLKASFKASFPVMADTTFRQFTVEALIKILAASTCMIDFFHKNKAASIFCDDRKFAFIVVPNNRNIHHQEG